MSREDTRHWQPPANEGYANASRRMGWVNDIVSCGEQWQAAQQGYKDLNRTIDMIAGTMQTLPNESRSNLFINRGKRALSEIISNLADIRQIDGYTSDNEQYSKSAQMLNMTWKGIHFESHFPHSFKRAMQWMAAGGVGYLSPVYRKIRMNARKGSGNALVFDDFGVDSVLPFQMPTNNDIQGCYAVTIIRFMPEYEAHGKFYKFQHKLRPVSRRRYGSLSKDRLSLAERFRMGSNPVSGAWGQQFDEIRYTYVKDLSINQSDKPVPMGAPGATWSYLVPYVGQQIPSDEFNSARRVTRPAEPEDCYLYPNLRLIISQQGMDIPLYDGPAFSWHGMFPLARFAADEWAWEQGYSLARDIFSVEETRQKFERGIDQTSKARFDPSMMYDSTSGLNRKTMESFDPYAERERLGIEGEISEKTLRTVLPADLLNVPGWAWQWSKYLDDAEDYMLGKNAMQNLAKAKLSSASGDAVENAMEMDGPVVKDISVSMEPSMQDLMEMVKFEILQNYSTGRIMQYVGPDGVSLNTFDFDPGALTPSHLVGEDPTVTSAYTRMERGKRFAENLRLTIAPNSLHGVPQMTQKLLYQQLQRSGFMISSETVAKAMDIPNFGVIEGATEVEKWQNEQKMKLEFAAQMKMLEGSLVPQGASAPPVPANHAKPGRPPSGHKAPQMKTKASAEGPRAVITES
jgi:hypothetical protein